MTAYTIAAVVAAHLPTALIAPLGASLQGSNLFLFNILSFKPSLSFFVTEHLKTNLYDIIDELIRVNVWEIVFGDALNVIIPDFFFPAEVLYFKRYYDTTVIYLRRLNGSRQHCNISPDICDYVVEYDETTLNSATRLVIDYLKKRYPQWDWICKPKVYISSNIMEGSPEVIKALADEAHQHGFIPLCPPDIIKPTEWVNLLEREKFSTACAEIIKRDIELIAESHAVFIYMHKPSIGCAAELICASLANKITVAVVPLSLLTHPWLFTFAKVFWEKRDEAWKYLRHLFLMEGNSP